MQKTEEEARAPLDEHQALTETHAGFRKALVNEHPRAILHELERGEMCVGDLAATLGIPMHKVSQHLRILKERLLVKARKDGNTVCRSVTSPRSIEGCTLIRQILAEQLWAARRSQRAVDFLGALRPAASMAAAALRRRETRRPRPQRTAAKYGHCARAHSRFRAEDEHTTASA